MKQQLSIICMFLGLLAAKAGATAPVSLAGEWRFALDPDAERSAENTVYPDSIKLPGMVTAQGFGEKPSIRTQWTGDGWRHQRMFREWQADDNFKMPFFLQPPLHYAGLAWFEREIEIPDAWADRNIHLFLERVHWQSAVWVDGREVGRADSLGCPHEFALGRLTPGSHRLTLCVDNATRAVDVGSMSHSVTDHTQGNWNGVVGRMELSARPAQRLERVRVFPKTDGSLRIEISGRAAGEARVEVRESGGGRIAEGGVAPAADGAFSVELHGRVSGEPRLWDEFQPELYHLEVSVTDAAGGGRETRAVSFGIRELGSQDGRITINGRKRFFRGTLECCIFPLSGHPPVDVESWKRIIRICKAHGLNHIRFHSWCPPEAAFTAADELGFYYQVEASSWGTVGDGAPLDGWLEAESRRMLDVYGNHPSLVLMAYGNEPGGGNQGSWLSAWVKRRQAGDGRHFYTTGAGWPVLKGSDFHSSPAPRIQAWGGGLRSVINEQAPRTDFDWADFVRRHSDAPVVSHEIGQWCVYPDFREIDAYNGYFKAENFEIFRETARRAGLLEQAGDFLNASGKLQVLAYKHDIEAALRTPGFGGFQLLDLHDFPGQGTALVGVLNAFWGEKGYISPAGFAEFSGPVVPLARMPKMIYQSGGTFRAETSLAQFGPDDISGAALHWALSGQDGRVVREGTLPARDFPSGETTDAGVVEFRLPDFSAACQLRFVLSLPGTQVLNAWDLFVYPRVVEMPEAAGVLVTRDLAEAVPALEAGRKVLWNPEPRAVMNDPERPLKAGFSPVFWNTAWTNWQPPHTLGVLCDPAHPALRGFPTEPHSNWQWWEVQHGAQPFILTPFSGLKPIVQVIDDWFTNRKLGYVFEAKVGKGLLLAAAVDLESADDKHPVLRQLKAALLGYMAGGDFQPECAIAAEELGRLVRPLPVLPRLGGRLEAAGAEPGYEAARAGDDDLSSMWHSAFKPADNARPHELHLVFPAAVELRGLRLSQRTDGNLNGQLREIELLDADGASVGRGTIPPDVRDFVFTAAKPAKSSRFTLRVLSSHHGPWASLAEIDVVVADGDNGAPAP